MQIALIHSDAVTSQHSSGRILKNHNTKSTIFDIKADMGTKKIKTYEEADMGSITFTFSRLASSLNENGVTPKIPGKVFLFS